tara:strand:+ start:314 stop:820 length:507 start_codon:yes stop_codon:yes gene_type:complete
MIKNFIKKSIFNSKKEVTLIKNKNQNSDLNKAFELIKIQRNSLQITKEELASITKISVNVIDAIENGRVDLFPESTFLKKMLLTLEKDLNLPINSLKIILENSIKPKAISRKRVYTPSSISIFKTWQGNIIYLFALFICLFILNSNYESLLEKKVITIDPLNWNADDK